MRADVEALINDLFKNVDIDGCEEAGALYNELLGNCTARYDDLIEQGISDETAMNVIRESLDGIENVMADFPKKKKEADDVLRIESENGDVEIIGTDEDRMHIEGKVTIENNSIISEDDDITVYLPAVSDKVVIVEVVNGDITAENITAVQIRLTTVQGDISISNCCAEVITSDAVEGDIDAELPEGMEICLSVHTVNGDTDIDYPATENGEMQLNLHSFNGDISVRKTETTERRSGIDFDAKIEMDVSDIKTHIRKIIDDIRDSLR